MTQEELRESLLRKIKSLSDSAWGGRITLPDVEAWLSQFSTSPVADDDEQLHALFLLSHFIYLGADEIRELLKSVFRDLYKTPILHEIRKANQNSRSTTLLEAQFADALARTRFVAVGNPSESGAHLLYFFRQENQLPKTAFISSHRIFRRHSSGGHTLTVLRDPRIKYYVFIDDLCGSGTQASEYSEDLVEPIKQEDPTAKVFYFVLFATSKGLKAIKDLNRYDDVGAVFVLDESFRAFSPKSRIFNPEIPPFFRRKVRSTARRYGQLIWPPYPLGYKHGQLLLGFSHNTPDNTLPIFWGSTAGSSGWMPIFRRYHKDYG